MKRLVSIVSLLGLLAIVSPTHADLVGFCDSLIGRMAGNWYRVLQGNTAQCSDLGTVLGTFVTAGCVPLLDSGQLFTAHIRSDLPPVQAACTALVCECGFIIPECSGVVTCS